MQGKGMKCAFLQKLLGNLDTEKMPEPIRNFVEAARASMTASLQVVDEPNYKKKEPVTVGTPIVKEWVIKNAGTQPWTQGLTLAKAKNVEVVEPPTLGEVQPGEVVTVKAKLIVMDEGHAVAVWKLQGEKGKLKAKFRGVAATDPHAANVNLLMNMGFTAEQARASLDQANGDLGVAISSIFHK